MDKLYSSSGPDQQDGALARSIAAWQELTGGHGRLLAAALAGAMAGITAMSIVNLAVPGMVRHFHLGQGQAQWVASAFLLTMAAALPAAPWLLQRWGLRCCYASATVLLMASGLLCASADSFNMVLLGRALQGLATGVMQPVPLLLVQRCIAAGWRGRVAGAMGTGVALAIAFGPLAAGQLIHWLDWRGVFALPLPLGLLSLLLLLRGHHRQARAGAGPAVADPLATLVGPAAQRPLDWLGLVLASLAVTGLLHALATAGAGSLGSALAALLLAGVAGAAFALRQQALNHKPGAKRPQPLVPAALMADRRYRLSCLAALLYGVVLNALTYLLPLLMHNSLGMDERQMGQLMMLAGLAMALTQPFAGAQVDTHGHRPLLGAGFLLQAAALALLPMAGGWGVAALAATAALCRVGLACAYAALFVPAQRALPTHLQPQGASLAQLTQTVGGAMGVGLAALALQWRLAMQGAQGIIGTAMPAHTQAMSEALWLLAGVALLAAALTWRLRSAKPA